MKNNNKTVFLGGTCAETVWREKLIAILKIDYFNPVVEDWTEECMKEERIQRETCDYCLYVITPSMQGVYSIAEVVDDSNKRPEKTIFCLLEKEIPKIIQVPNLMCYLGSSDIRMTIDEEVYPSDKIIFNKSEMKSLNQVGKMVERNGGKYFKSLKEIAEYLNKITDDELEILHKSLDGDNNKEMIGIKNKIDKEYNKIMEGTVD